jgi:pyridoxal phosphate-dependent aminotransferase EpsN
MTNLPPIYLSPPHLSGQEYTFIQEALMSNWISTTGPQLATFEKELCALSGAAYAVALNSGTAAIHLALQLVGVQAGDEVLCPTFSFVASTNPILYQGATPVFIDSEPDTWNMCPQALERAVEDRIKTGIKPKALVLVHLYGMPAKLKEILAIAHHYQIPVIEDAAEALGSTYAGKPLGTFGTIGIYSFNGNKIITTSGGGALVTNEAEYAEKALFLASQAKEPAPHYQHSVLGYNYRLSNILAGLGLGQLAVLPERVEQRRANYAYYRQQLAGLEQITFLSEPHPNFSNRWLTCICLAPGQPVTPEQIRLALAAEHIEARPLWKPLHRMPLFQDYRYFGGQVAEDLFTRGLCLPSGSALTLPNLDRIITVIKNQFG